MKKLILILIIGLAPVICFSQNLYRFRVAEKGMMIYGDTSIHWVNDNATIIVNDMDKNNLNIFGKSKETYPYLNKKESTPLESEGKVISSFKYSSIDGKGVPCVIQIDIMQKGSFSYDGVISIIYEKSVSFIMMVNFIDS